MNKLQQLLPWLVQNLVYQTQAYIYFQTENGEPNTVTVNAQDQLIVSGSTPGGGLKQFTDVIACVKHLKSMNPNLVPLTGIILM